MQEEMWAKILILFQFTNCNSLINVQYKLVLSWSLSSEAQMFHFYSQHWLWPWSWPSYQEKDLEVLHIVNDQRTFIKSCRDRATTPEDPSKYEVTVPGLAVLSITAEFYFQKSLTSNTTINQKLLILDKILKLFDNILFNHISLYRHHSTDFLSLSFNTVIFYY